MSPSPKLKPSPVKEPSRPVLGDPNRWLLGVRGAPPVNSNHEVEVGGGEDREGGRGGALWTGVAADDDEIGSVLSMVEPGM